jgi:hypothetical protein
MARSYGAAAIAPPFQTLYGVPTQDAPFVSSAFVEWNYTFVKSVPFGDEPAPEKTNTHECLRNVRVAAAWPPRGRCVAAVLWHRW